MAETNLREFTGQEKLNKMAVDLITISPAITNATYSDGDLMLHQEALPFAVAVKGGSCVLQSLTAVDTSDTGGSIYVIITDTQADLGTVGSAINAAAAAADNSMAIVELSNFIDVGGAKVATKGNIGLVLKAGDNSRQLYFGIVNVSGSDITIGSGEDIHLRFGIVKD